MSGLVSVLLSLYHPNELYLIKQLDTINAQTYPLLEVIVYNDCPDDINRRALVEEHLSRCDVKYVHGEENLGYVKAFERLVSLANGEYLAFCDQDDEWVPSRIARGVAALEKGAVLVICDRSIIDANGTVETASWRHAHPRSPEVNWDTGDDITSRAAFTCYGIGMAMMIRADVARSLQPFPEHTGHDKWLTLAASELGPCAFIDEPLVKYRRHGRNLTGAFKGIASREEWYRDRTVSSYELARRFADRFPESEHNAAILEFAEARLRGDVRRIFHARSLAPLVAWFEIGLNLLPSWLVDMVLGRLSQR